MESIPLYQVLRHPTKPNRRQIIIHDPILKEILSLNEIAADYALFRRNLVVSDSITHHTKTKKRPYASNGEYCNVDEVAAILGVYELILADAEYYKTQLEAICEKFDSKFLKECREKFHIEQVEEHVLVEIHNLLRHYLETGGVENLEDLVRQLNGVDKDIIKTALTLVEDYVANGKPELKSRLDELGRVLHYRSRNQAGSSAVQEICEGLAKKMKDIPEVAWDKWDEVSSEADVVVAEKEQMYVTDMNSLLDAMQQAKSVEEFQKLTEQVHRITIEEKVAQLKPKAWPNIKKTK